MLIILASVTTYTGANTIKNARYYNAVSELKAMKTKVDQLYEEYQNADYDAKATILNQGEDTTEKATELSNSYYVASQNNKTYEDLGNEEDYRYYSNDYIKNNLDVDGIDRDFFINIKARSVLLVDGIEYQNETYYALCQIEGEQFSVKYTPPLRIYFDANGGTINQTSKIVSYGEKYGKLPTPTKDGYTFLGWTYGNVFNPQEFYEIGKNYNVSIDGNDIILVTYPYQENVTQYPVQCEENTPYLFSFDWEVLSISNGDWISAGLGLLYTDDSYFSGMVFKKTVGEFGHSSYVTNSEKTIKLIRSAGWQYAGRMKISNIILGKLIDNYTIVNLPESHTLQAQWEPNS